MIMYSKSFLFQLGGIALLSRCYVEAKKALKGHCGSKGRKVQWRCKKSKENPTMNPTLVPTETSVPSLPPTVVPLKDDTIKEAVNLWNTNEDLAKSTYGNIKDWDVSQTTKLMILFSGSEFNGDVSGWNVAGVTNMIGMFTNAKGFNQNLSSWNVAKVTSFNAMFDRCSSFNQNLSKWNVAKATNMKYMFDGATSFDQNLCSWGQQIFSSNPNDVTKKMFGSTGCFEKYDVSLDYFCHKC